MVEHLQALIASKKRQLEENGLISNEKKFFKRSELERVATEQESPEKQNSKTPDQKKNDTILKEAEFDGAPQLQRSEVIRRLRDRGEPILLFNETSLESFKRLRQLEIIEPEINRGFRNDFQEALESVDQAYVDEIVKTSDNTLETATVSHEAVSLEELSELAKSIPAEGSVEISCKVILQFLQLINTMWNSELQNRDEKDRVSVRGKMDSATYKQTQQYMKPLTKRLIRKSLPEDILESLTEIVMFCLDRDYVQATSSYLQMAIGNAPWPIGVTMVGIHARTGREKISSRHVAHVLNDETQRKYIQGLKRIITKCQSFFPTDPSKCVEYNASK